MNQIPEALRPGKHRVHHSYVWLGGLYATFIVFMSVGFSLASSIGPQVMGEGMPTGLIMLIVGASLVVGLLIVAIIIFVQWLSWKNLSYELSEAEFNLYSGIISKKRRHLPYQRVQAVNQSAGIIQRILGLCNVQIDTAGGEANEAVSLRYIRNSDAEALRAELFRRKKVLLADGRIDADGNAFVNNTVIPSAWTLACHGGNAYDALISLGVSPEQAAQAVSASYQPGAFAAAAQPAQGNVLDAADEILSDVRGVFGGQEVHTGQVSYETGLSNKELLLAGFSGAADYLGVLALGVIGASALVMPAIEGMIGSWVESMASSFAASLVSVEVDGVASAITLGLWDMVIWCVLGLAGLWLLSALGTMVRYGGFKARRRESRIEVEHGLLKRTFHGVDVDRVQSVIIDQGFITRLLGYCEVRVAKIDSSSPGEDPLASLGTGVVLHPFLKASRVPELLQGLLPEFDGAPQETLRPPRVALRRAIIRKGIIRSSFFWIFLVALALQVGLYCVPSLPLSSFASAVMKSILLMVDGAFLMALLIHTVDAVLWYRHTGMGFNRAFVSMTDGGLTLKTVVFPRKKIQFAHTRTNPFQRMAKVQTVVATTAAGISGTAVVLWDLREEDAEAFLDWVKPRA